MNGRLLTVLVLALLGSSLVLVHTSYESRRLFAELDRARVDQRKLNAEFKRLDAEAQAQATHLRVEKLAREKLRMRTATPAVTERVEDTLVIAIATAIATATATATPQARLGTTVASTQVQP